MNRNKTIQIASIISVAGNLALAVSKVSIGFISGSLSVLGDGLDSFSDVFISIITLAISVVIARPPDKEHPYGHFRAETIATAILAFIIFFIGGQLSLSSLQKLLSHDYATMPEATAVYVTVFSIMGKLVLSWSQYKLGRKSGSAMIIANGKNMLNDIITSSGVLVGLACMYYFNAPIIDRILAIIIGIWIMITAVRIFAGTVNEMMEGETDMALYKKVFQEAKNIDHLYNPHRVRIRKLGVYYLIEMDIEADEHATIKDTHDKVIILENNIRASNPYIYDVLIHIEPLGNIEKHERWGLKEQDAY
ncbi:MAG TPA: cation diffusion facilitator family transporter [Spirochaetota bacterium]|nr:cation transporter [Spirochaetota bacterium]HOD15835.1 cation diffusion facilitator family transporter [Spirochaetota bacterium]HPG51379.1 cation diffusion facilitator family transporter [Spirochaetota bacterium]HPN11023.1 cation diffusion facilitator family transporter [Spirochaetota bacterium]HQL81382.1 cation diffusion facilitator family transporter [Spirochaetota bacterium]